MKLLSILVSLVMLLTVCCVAETPEATAPTVVTIRDAVVTIDGEEYPLNPSIVLGAVSEDGSALIDVGMPLGDHVLFPVQAKIDESGLGLLLGQSNTAYTLTPAFFEEMLDSAEMPDEFFTMMQSYGELLSAATSMDQAAMLEQQQAAGEKFMELIGDVPSEEATFHANGQDQVGQHVVFTLTNEQMVEYMNYCYSLMPADYTEAYFDYLNATFRMAGMPEADSFGDIFAMSGMEMSIDGDMIYNETSGVADLVFHVTIDPAAATIAEPTAETAAQTEPVTFDMPMEITVHTPENAECVVDMDVEGIQMAISSAIVDGSQTASMTISDEETVSMAMSMTMQPQENGSYQFDFDMNMDVDSATFAIAVDSVPGDAGSTTACEISFSDESFSCGASFAVDVTHDAIADRTGGATVAEINSLDELESNSGLMMAAMSLMGDVEKLMSDESVAALIEAVQEYLIVPETGAESVEETVEIADNSEYAAVSEPEFGWLPEGYALTESTLQPDASCASFCIEKEIEDGNYSTIYIDMSANAYSDHADTATYAIIGGSAQPVDGIVISIERDEDGSIYAYTVVDNTNINLSCFDADLTDDEIVQLLSGITFPDAVN